MATRTQLGFSFAPAPPRGDICANKHKGNKQSVAANVKAEPGKASMRERVRLFISGCGHHGTTLKEICLHVCKLPHQISGRITELKADGLVFDSGRKSEDGYTVLVGYRGWVNGTTKEVQ